MPANRSSRIAQVRVRLAVSLAVLVLVLAQQGVIRAEGASGQDHSDCVTACNETQRICNLECHADCRGLFPDPSEGLAQCQGACMDDCQSDQTECRQFCESIKFDTSPETP